MTSENDPKVLVVCWIFIDRVALVSSVSPVILRFLTLSADDSCIPAHQITGDYVC